MYESFTISLPSSTAALVIHRPSDAYDYSQSL